MTINRFLLFTLVFALTFANGAIAAEEPVYDTVISESWSEVLFSNKKIGFSFQKIESGPEGYKITGRAMMRMSVMDTKQDLSFFQTFLLDKQRNVTSFINVQKIGAQRMTTFGKLFPGRIELEISGAGGSQRVVKKIPDGTGFIETFVFQNADRFKEGYKKTFPVFLASLRAVDSLTVTFLGSDEIMVDGVKTAVSHIQTSMHGFSTSMLVTENGISVREKDNMLGVTTRKSTEKQALTFPETSVSVSSLITFSLVKPDKPVHDPDNAKTMKFLIGGLKSPKDIPRDNRQSAGSPSWSSNSGGERVMSLPVTITKIRPKRSIPLAKAGKGFGQYLESTPEAQSDHGLIRYTALKIVGKEKETWNAAQRLNFWVFENLDKKLVDSFTAVDVLKAKEGECQAHTNLFTAMARSVGIPTRIASGLVYSRIQKGFLYHAWPEIHVGEWIAIDPTLGQDVADVTHIKLIEGGIGNSLKLVKYIGRISLKVN